MTNQDEVLTSALQGLRRGPRKAVRVDEQKGTATLHPRLCEEQTLGACWWMKPEPKTPSW